jgi:hypothetical protein
MYIAVLSSFKPGDTLGFRLSLFKIGNNEMQIGESFPYRI